MVLQDGDQVYMLLTDDRVDGVTASMEMAQPFPDVWLPRAIRIALDFSTAAGEVDGRFATDYHDYRLASVSSRIR